MSMIACSILAGNWCSQQYEYKIQTLGYSGDFLPYVLILFRWYWFDFF